jgi:diguanylate cyclase (GGDEF)-like protein
VGSPQAPRLKAAKVPPESGSPRDRGRVLVVDDSRLVRLVIREQLESAGYEVSEASDGGSALALLGQGALDVVITDLNMPGLDGFEVLAAVKERAPGVEVIILTGARADDIGAVMRALRLGAHDYLTKPPAHADEVVLAVERAIEKKRLREMNQRLLLQLEALSLTDALTDVPNRRAFDQALEREAARALRHKHPLGIVMLDIDHFKTVNDTYGHGRGDEVLRAFAQAALGALRKGDSLYRFGGEEFVALLAHADPTGAALAAGRMITAAARLELRAGPSTFRITASAGVACLDGQGDGPEVLARADAALYEAKRTGRNRVCSAPSA